jgi:hypothetical protein
MPVKSEGLFRPVDYEKQFANLLSAEGYRALLAESSGPGAVCVESIRYDTKGGKYGDKNLLLRIALVDHFGRAVSNAAVQAHLEIDDVWVSFEGTTDAEGTLVYEGKDLSPANLKTLIDHLGADGLVWAGHYSTPENKFRM